MSIKASFTDNRGGLSFGDLKFYLSVIAAFAFAFFVFLPKTPPATPEQIAQAAAQAAAPHEPNWSSVCASAIVYIEDRLKSPGSGSGFSDCHIVSVSSDKKMVLIRGSFTAVNSFNARIKETYAATLNRNDARDDHGWNVSAFTN